MVVTDPKGYMTKIVEKPSEPISRRANIGLYYIKDWKALYDGITWTLGQPKNKGEYFLTDAFQHMIDHGKKIRVADVGGWYDCGKVDTTLETQAHLLRSRGHIAKSAKLDGTTIVEPVRIEENVVLTRCTIGPNVTIGAGSDLNICTVADSILGDGVRLSGCRVKGSILGDGVQRSLEPLENVIAAGSETTPAR